MKTLRQIETETLSVGAQAADQALRLLQGGEYDLIQLDLMLPGINGMIFLGVLRKRFAKLPVVTLSALDDADTVARAMGTGASGFLPNAGAAGCAGCRSPSGGTLWHHSRANAGAGTLGAGKDHSGDRRTARSGRGNGQDSCLRRFQGAQGSQPWLGADDPQQAQAGKAWHKSSIVGQPFSTPGADKLVVDARRQFLTI